MKTKCSFAAVLCTAAMAGAVYGGAVIELGPADARTTLRWQTVLPGRKTVQWVWPTAAQSAKLTLSGLKGSREIGLDRSVSSYDLGHLPVSAEAEDLLSMKLEFFASSDTTGSALADETLVADGVGFVRTQTAKIRACAQDTRKWSRVAEDVVVAQVDAGAKVVSRDAEPLVLVSAPGWVGCLSGEVGSRFSMTLTDGDGTYEASLVHRGTPLAIVVR